MKVEVTLQFELPDNSTAEEVIPILRERINNFDYINELVQWVLINNPDKSIIAKDLRLEHLEQTISAVPTLVQDNKEKPYEGKKLVNFNELSEYGLIWKINKDILHPLGLALARNTDGTSNGCMVASDRVWEYDNEANRRNLEKYDNFLNLLK